MSGIGFGDGPTALVFTLAVVVLVIFLAVARPDIQAPNGAEFRQGGPQYPGGTS
jgi:hypothetical protein